MTITIPSLYHPALEISTTPTPLSTAVNALLPLPVTPTVAPTVTPTATPTRLPSATPSSTPAQALQPANQSSQLKVLRELWDAVNQNYLYEDFNGLDWQAIYTEYHSKILAGMSDQDFYLAMDEMIMRLGDKHSTFFSPQQAQQEDADFSGEYNYVGIGVLTDPVPERQRITIILVFPDSPAQVAGLREHDNILAVDGQPILDENGDRRDLLRGPEGSQVSLTVQTPGQEPRQVEITRQWIKSELPLPSQVLNSPGGKRIGYIQLTTFSDATMPAKVRSALLELAGGGRLNGLILDNRNNEGGAGSIFESILAYFENGKLGYFFNRQGKEPLLIEGRDIAGSQKIPLVVLVGRNTVSFGEIFSGILKDTQRAFLIGETTDGNVEILYVFEFFDGSRAWIAHERFQPLNHPDQDWEESGVIPDLLVPSNWDEVTHENDPAIQAALGHFDQ